MFLGRLMGVLGLGKGCWLAPSPWLGWTPPPGGWGGVRRKKSPEGDPTKCPPPQYETLLENDVLSRRSRQTFHVAGVRTGGAPKALGGRGRGEMPRGVYPLDVGARGAPPCSMRCRWYGVTSPHVYRTRTTPRPGRGRGEGRGAPR